MTLTIDLTPAEEADLTAAARQAGLAPESLVKNLVKGILPPAAAPERNGNTPAARVLERFHGTVDHVTDGVAFLTMENDREVLSSAELTVEQMTQYGLSPTEDFECIVTEQDNRVTVAFALRPRRRLSADEAEALRVRIDDTFRDLGDDF